MTPRRFDFESRLDRFERNRRLQWFLASAIVFLVLGLTPIGFVAVYANLQRSWFAVREALFPIEFEMDPAFDVPAFLRREG